MNKGALVAHNTDHTSFATQNMNLQFEDDQEGVGCVVEGLRHGACSQGHTNQAGYGEVLKNAPTFDFTFILQKVNQYLFTPVHLCHMAFCYKVTRARTCLF